MTVPHRHVRIAKDSASPCWFITCAKPCTPEGWCQIAPNGERLCWLGAGSTAEVAARLAKRVRYTVATDTTADAQGEAPAASSDAAASRVAARR